MSIPSAESLLISALINVGDVGEAAAFGISADYFRGYRDEFNWIQTYLATYAEQPSRDIFCEQFPSFPFSEHANVRAAVDKVLKTYSKQQINAAINDAVDLLGFNEITLAYERLTEAKPRTTSAKPKRLLTDMTFFDTWAEGDRGIEVPYKTLQRHTGGIKPGNLWYLASRTGMGKSAHLCNIATHAVLQGANVVFYSLEMSEMEIRARFHAALASHFGYPWKGAINVQDIRDRRVDMKLYKEFIQHLDGKIDGILDIHTPRDGIVSPSVVNSRAKDYDLSIIDYVTLMRTDKGSSAIDDWRTAASISNQLKEISLSAPTAVLAAAQINREGEGGIRPPKLKNLAQSDALGQDGDVVITMISMEGEVASYMSLEKNRHGQSGVKCYTTFDPNLGIYRNINADQAETLVLEAGLR